ncbi:MAG: RidA family protein, partial [Longimicrobiales bacterium]
EDLLKCTVFLADIADYEAMNAVYAEYFPTDPPARAALAGSGLALGALVEVDCIAVAPEGT